MKTLKAIIAFVAMGAFIAPNIAFGFAYRLPTQTTKGLAKGNAVVTELNEPESVYYNPAATAFSKGFQVTFGSQYETNRSDHENKPFVDEKSRRKSAYIPNFFATWNLAPLNLENATLGFGASSPFGLAQVWKQESPIAPVVQKAKLKVIDYMITGAYKVNEKISVGSGIDITYSDGTLKRIVDFGSLVGMPRALDGLAKFRGKDTSVGWNASVLCKPAENHSLAFTFRSQQTPHFDGHIKVRPPAALGLPLLSGDGEARLVYPMILQGAYGYQWNKLKLEFVLDWARWQSLNNLRIRSTSNPLIADTAYRANYNNVFTYNASATYAICPNLDWHFGFIWTETPIPKNTFNAFVPDSDRFALSTGLSWKVKQLQVDAAFQWVHFEGRSINNSVGVPFGGNVNGNYDTDAFLVGLNATFRF